MSDISVLFSGGPDSTLAALRALDEAERVHLVTYHHRLMSRMGGHTIVVDEMKERFGEERIVTHEEEIGELFREMYFKDWQRRLPKYRTYYVPWMCGACKLAMHTRTIAYNMEHGIRKTYDGANTESSPLFPAQTREYISVMQEYYGRYGMEYDAIIFDDDHTDEQCTAYGLKTLERTKKEHVVFSTQHSCVVGLAIHAHARLYYKPFRGRDRMKNISGPFLEEMIDILGGAQLAEQA